MRDRAHQQHCRARHPADRAVAQALLESQSDTGERFTEWLLTVIGTCRIQGINPFAFLIEVGSAAFSGERSLPVLPLLLQQSFKGFSAPSVTSRVIGVLLGALKGY